MFSSIINRLIEIDDNVKRFCDDNFRNPVRNKAKEIYDNFIEIDNNVKRFCDDNFRNPVRNKAKEIYDNITEIDNNISNYCNYHIRNPVREFCNDKIAPNIAPNILPAIAGAVLVPTVLAIAVPSIPAVTVSTIVGGAITGVLYNQYGECNEETVRRIAEVIVNTTTRGYVPLPRNSPVHYNHRVEISRTTTNQ